MSVDSRVYRDRIYRSYSSGRETPLAPTSLKDLGPRVPYLTKLVDEHLPIDRTVSILELGCGHGALLHILHKAGYSGAKGIDGSHEQVAAAKTMGIKGVELGDVMETLTLTPSESLDVVFAFDVIEHFTKDELIPLVDQVQRVLKEGGRWIIHAPNAESPYFARVRYGDFTHEQAFTRVSLNQLLRSSGFRNVECFEDRPVAHGFVSAVRLLLWQLVRSVQLAYIAVETGAIDKKAIFSQNFLAVAYKNPSEN